MSNANSPGTGSNETVARNMDSGVVAARHLLGVVAGGGDAGPNTKFADNGGLILANVHVYLIFWGTTWGTSPTPTAMAVEDAVRKILAGPYMAALAQYRSIGRGTLVGKTLATFSDPPNPFADSDVENLISNRIDAGVVPNPANDDQLLFLVIMRTGVVSNGSFIGEHSFFTKSGRRVHYGWVTNSGNLDALTTIFSHELVESVSDPEGSAILGVAGTCSQTGWCEIGDVCTSSGVVNGVRVQSYWSQLDKACIIPAGQDNWRWCRKCQGIYFAGSSTGACPAGGGHDHSGSGDYTLLQGLDAAAGQDNWRWCNKCQGLAFAGNPALGSCPGGGNHDHVGSGNYKLVFNNPADPGQKNWRWCNKCQGLHFAGNFLAGACPAGGGHDHAGSGNYDLRLNDPSAPGQNNWRWCRKCQGLAFAGNATPGPCPSGGSHDHAGSANYQLLENDTVAPGQDNWRWCHKCQGIYFAGNSTGGACPAGGGHDQAGSANYKLVLNANPGGPGQDNWRWCHKCQGLYFAGNLDLGSCPAGNGHNHSGSGDYSLMLG